MLFTANPNPLYYNPPCTPLHLFCICGCVLLSTVVVLSLAQFFQPQKRSSLKMKALVSSSCLPSSACGRRPSLPLFLVCLCVLGLRCPCNNFYLRFRLLNSELYQLLVYLASWDKD